MKRRTIEPGPRHHFGLRWSPAEDEAVRAHYRTATGRERLARLLPHRSAQALTQRAFTLGLHAMTYRAPWSREEDATLRIAWGEVGWRTMHEKLPGRSRAALICRARLLGLPPQSQGKAVLRDAEKRLGVTGETIRLMADQVGMRLDAAAPVPSRDVGTREGKRRPFRRLDIDLEVFEELLRQRDLRVSTAHAWALRHDLKPGLIRNRLAVRGLNFPVARRGGCTLTPAGVLAEMQAHAEGPWCALWRRVLAAKDRPCAPWLLALVMWDVSRAAEAPRTIEGDAVRAAADWVQWAVPQGVLGFARALLFGDAPGAVRCGSGARGEERAA